MNAQIFIIATLVLSTPASSASAGPGLSDLDAGTVAGRAIDRIERAESAARERASEAEAYGRGVLAPADALARCVGRFPQFVSWTEDRQNERAENTRAGAADFESDMRRSARHGSEDPAAYADAEARHREYDQYAARLYKRTGGIYPLVQEAYDLIVMQPSIATQLYEWAVRGTLSLEETAQRLACLSPTALRQLLAAECHAATGSPTSGLFAYRLNCDGLGRWPSTLAEEPRVIREACETVWKSPESCD